MRVLIVGSGGREHTLAWAVSRSPKATAVFIAPGNPGTAEVGENVALSVDDIPGLLTFAQNETIDLTIVGPEVPLVNGIADAFAEAGLRLFGPSAAAARIEGSKSFAKDFMARHGVPTASYATFDSTEYDVARAYLEEEGAPVVLKASGLAAGKGVIVAETMDEAIAGLDAILKEERFGSAGAEVVIESFMAGEEASVFALTDGTSYCLLRPAQDHKRIGEGDTGPNTGGMGAYAPAPIMTPAMLDRVCAEVIEPTLAGMREEGHPFVGFLYCGLMISEEGPRVVEFNCRMGDPETQVVFPMLEDDLLTVLDDLLNGRVLARDLRYQAGSVATVVLASEGYPGSYPKGRPITGVEQANQVEGCIVFQAGTRMEEQQLVTSGGRVLNVVAAAGSLQEALDRAYKAIDHISFEGMQFRRDIGQKGLRSTS